MVRLISKEFLFPIRVMVGHSWGIQCGFWLICVLTVVGASFLLPWQLTVLVAVMLLLNIRLLFDNQSGVKQYRVLECLADCRWQLIASDGTNSVLQKITITELGPLAIVCFKLFGSTRYLLVSKTTTDGFQLHKLRIYARDN